MIQGDRGGFPRVSGRRVTTNHPEIPPNHEKPFPSPPSVRALRRSECDEAVRPGLTGTSMFIQGFDLDGANEFSLSIQGPHPASASGTVWIASPDLSLGWAAATRSIHRCLAGRLAWCYACDMYHDPDDADACPYILGQTAAPADRVSFPSGTNGTAVVVHGDNAGYVTLTVHITSYAGPPPICEAKVVPETVVPVHAFIICSASGTPATTTNRVVSLLSGANDIYAQVGRRFELASCSTITNEDWLAVPELNGRWPKFQHIVNYTNGTNAIEMYFNQTIVDANGLTNPNGVLTDITTILTTRGRRNCGFQCELMDMPLFKRPFRIRKGKQFGSYHPSSAQVKQKCKQRRLVAHISGKKVKEWHKESTDTWQKAPQFYVRNATSLAP